MGWTTKLGFTREDIIAHVTKGWEDRSGGVVSSGRYLDHEVVGNIVWAVLELTTAEGAVEISSRLITATRIGTEKIDHRLHWGYADGGSEGNGLQWDHCPLRFLEMVPAVDDRWRGRVRVYHADRQNGQRKSNPMQVGTVMAFPMTDPRPGQLMCPFCGEAVATLPYVRSVTGPAMQKAAEHFYRCPHSAYMRVDAPGLWEVTVWMYRGEFVAATVRDSDGMQKFFRRSDFLSAIPWMHLKDALERSAKLKASDASAIQFDAADVARQLDELLAMLDDMSDFKGVAA